jgi:hypothetical protein
MAKAYICSLCGRPILEAEHMEGYQNQLQTWEPLHKRCAEVLNDLAERSGQDAPILRDGFFLAHRSPDWGT